MATSETISLNITGNALQQLQKVETQVKKVSGVFTNLRNVLGGLAIGNFVAGVLSAADAMDDVADSTQLALTSVLGFSEAVRQNGGDTNDAVSAMQKFILSIQEARDGSIATQSAFKKLGISTDDLSKSNTELFVQSIEGFKNLSKATDQAKVSQELFGKSLRGVALGNVARDFAPISAEQRQYVESTRDAAKAQKELNRFIISLQQSLLPAAKTLGDLAQALNENKAAIKSFVETAIEIGKVVAAFFIFGRILRVIVLGVQYLSGAFAGLLTALGGLRNTFGAFLTQIKAVWREGAVTQRTYDGLAKRFKYLKEEVPLLSKALAVLGAASVIAYQQLKKLFDTTDFSKPLVIQGTGAMEAPTGYDNILQYIEARREAAQEDEKARNKLIELGDEIRANTKSYQQQNAEVLRGLDLQKMQLTATDDEIELQTALIDNSERLRVALADLQKQRDAAAADPEKSSLVPVIEEEMNAIRRSAVETHNAITSKITDTQAYRQSLKELENDITNTFIALQTQTAIEDLQEQLSLIGLEGDALERQQTLLEANRSMRDKLISLAEEMAKLELNKDKLGEAAYNREKTRIQNQILDAYALRDAKIQAKEDEISAIEEIENAYYEGAKRALKSLAEQYKPINVAQDAIMMTWQKIGDAVDTFVETGKFKFSDFARSVIQDLAKMIAKAAIFFAIGTALKAIFPGSEFLKTIFKAQGGPVKGGSPYIVGEKGPELFVPQNSGKIVPNNQLGTASTNAMTGPITNNYNTYNINALDAKSVAQLFAENRKAIFGANKLAEREMSYAGVR
jgi:hypothetical protein